ncbi:hypothetical protein ASPCAL02942 [Aspergillus calidoustus]|uniref:Leucine-rich repeat domain-containing protein n=1 Tax=Aspergillus calidoustus TaxID=454130 RepID=A0A0U5GLS9_ASPCI|nr:hypothetical protein ASPCAL02942 [Aspergillus calidoustus]
MLQLLPSEVQLLIAQHLGTADKAALVLTSHHFYSLVIPSLYENIENTYDQGLMRLVDTLARNPSLRAFPRSLTLEAWDTPSTDNPADVWIDPHEEELDFPGYRLGLLCRLAKAACPVENEAVTWCRHLRNSNADALLALILTLVPNLFRLEVQFPKSVGWVQRVIEWAVAQAQPIASLGALQRLKEVYVSAQWLEFQDKNQDVTRWTLMFLGLPSLRRITTDGLFHDEDETMYKSTSSSVTQIRLDYSIGVYDLDRLIRHCPNLESYRHHYSVRSRRRHFLNPRELYPGFLLASHSLKELWLDIFPTFIIKSDSGVHWQTFKTFPLLELLHVPYFLLGQYKADTLADLAAMLPSSLKKLHVTEIDKTTLESVLRSCLEYVLVAPAQLSQLIIATMSTLADRDGIMTAVEMDTNRRIPDLTPAERAAPAIKYATELSTRCSPLGIRFGIYEPQRSNVLAPWAPFDPFEEAR